MKHRDERILFWGLQLAGWLPYGAAKLFVGEPNFSTVVNIIMLLITGVCASMVLRELYKRLRSKPISFPFLLLNVIVASIGMAVIWVYVLDIVILRELLKRPVVIAWFDLKQGFLNKGFVLLAWSFLYIVIKSWQDLQRQRAELFKAEALAQQAQLQMLRYQLNPHFLFNALSSIRAVVDEDGRKAKEMLSSLSDFLRYTLAHSIAGQVPLRDEISAIRKYLDIELLQFEEKLDASIDVDHSIEDCLVPSFFLHPLVDNAIKHGMKTSLLPLRVRISVRDAGNTIHFEIANTGSWQERHEPDSSRMPVGISNTRNRLQHMYPGKHAFDIARQDGWIRVHVDIPKTGIKEHQRI